MVYTSNGTCVIEFASTGREERKETKLNFKRNSRVNRLSGMYYCVCKYIATNEKILQLPMTTPRSSPPPCKMSTEVWANNTKCVTVLSAHDCNFQIFDILLCVRS